VLIGSEDEAFEQIITDERLAPARVANHNSRVAAAPDATRELVSKAIVEQRSIVGWSLFDRDRLREACPDLAFEIGDRYVNALQIARPWRKALHPNSPVDREDPFAPHHTLDKYAILAGYSGAARLKKASPAKWIRHMLKQLQATKGRYRRTTQETKRDWHRLLEYNRHDCLALRHIVLKATRELECWRSYERTRFCVDAGPRRICFMAGSKNARLQQLLERHGAVRWAFLTAWNPASVELSRTENDARQRELRAQLEADGYVVLQGEGIGADPAWKPEESLMVLGISRADAVKLGRRFGQLAIVSGRSSGAARLISCA
jgi:hypothetical protein